MTSKKNSNITSYANESSKSNQDTKTDTKKLELEEQVIDDHSINEEDDQKDFEDDNESPGIEEQRESKTNIAEQFRLAM